MGPPKAIASEGARSQIVTIGIRTTSGQLCLGLSTGEQTRRVLRLGLETQER